MKPGSEQLKFVGDLTNHPLLRKKSISGGKKSKQTMYIHIVNSWLDFWTCDVFSKVLENQHHYYRDTRISIAMKQDCLNDKKIKDFESSEDLLRLMSGDICKKM